MASDITISALGPYSYFSTMTTVNKKIMYISAITNQNYH